MTHPRARHPIEPRLLSREEAARYCGISANFFTSVCPVIPIKIRSRVLWDRKSLDRWIDTCARKQRTA